MNMDGYIPAKLSLQKSGGSHSVLGPQFAYPFLAENPAMATWCDFIVFCSSMYITGELTQKTYSEKMVSKEDLYC